MFMQYPYVSNDTMRGGDDPKAVDHGAAAEDVAKALAGDSRHPRVLVHLGHRPTQHPLAGSKPLDHSTFTYITRIIQFNGGCFDNLIYP